MRKYIVGLILSAVASPAFAQGAELAARCQEVPTEVRQSCITVAQAVDAAQPQLGILLAGGSPELGTASTSGVRLGLLPRASGSLRVNAVFARIPDVLGEGLQAAADPADGELGIVVPALGATLSLGLLDGVSLAPTVGGFGSVDLLASATWLPFALLDVDGFGGDSPGLSWGLGARVGLLRESFTTPGVSVSVMYRALGETRFGDVCPDGTTQAAGAENCLNTGDPGELLFDLTGWSGRAVVGKRLLGLGLTAGVGFDRFASDADFAFRAEPIGLAGTPVQGQRIRRIEDVELENDRWSAFANLSYTFLVGSFVLEGGWMQGGDAVPGFTSSEFDPGRGTIFGSAGVKLSL